MDYYYRILGQHPQKHKNIGRDDKIRTFRFASETLPGDSETEEVKNTLYPVLKRRFNPSWKCKDVTARKPVVSVMPPCGGKPVQIEFVSYGQQVQAGAGVQRRCLAKGTRVLRSDGVWSNIEDIMPGDELVSEALGSHGTRQRSNKVKNVWCSGKKQVMQVNCQKGMSFIATPEHRMMVPGNGKSEYREVSELKIGDTLICRFSEIEGNKTLSDGLVVWLAAILGDGHTGKDGIFFTSKSNRLVGSLKSFLPVGARIRQRRSEKYGTPQYAVYYQELKTLLEQEGLIGKKAGEKFVPDIIFQQDNATIKLFLRYLYATDGWASRTVGYCSTSFRLAQDVFLLLRRIGIKSQINERKSTHVNWNTQWWVIISQSKNIIKFLDEVGIECKEEYEEKIRIIANKRISSRYINGNTPVKQRVSIKYIAQLGEQEVYDIEMEPGGWDTRLKNGVYKQRKKARSPRDNFLIQGGLVSHNSVLIDEEPSRDFYEEQIPRLLAADGDMLIAFTPVPGEIGWMFDDLYERARFIYRTKTVRDRIKLRTGEDLPEIQETESKEDIAVIMAATDDNPIYKELAAEKSGREGRTITATEYIDEMFSVYADEDVVDARRYGIFRQLSGKIFKAFQSKTHVISGEKYFPDGLPYDWKYFRGIDWHETTPWAIGWITVSPEDEIFVYNEFNPSPEKLITLEIARVIASRSGDYRFVLNLIDPLASKIQPNTGMSSLEDLNRIFAQYHREGLGTGGYWQVWDTKSQKGRDEIRKRLANSIKVGMPFNNLVKQEGISRRLPTIWFLDNCTQTIQSMKNWRREEWSDRNKLQSKEEKETPQQRWSHFCTMLEGLMKRPEVFQARFGSVGGGSNRPKNYFKAV